MENSRRYVFSWDLLGDIDGARPNMGNTTRVEIYRLMQFTFRDVLEREYGADAADRVFLEAGKLAGSAFFEHYLKETQTLTEFVSRLQEVMRELGVGILRVEQLDMDKGELMLTVSEDLDCSGLPEDGIEICTYDEGFIEALLSSFTGKPFQVREVDCWCTGDRTCRFEAKALPVGDPA